MVKSIMKNNQPLCETDGVGTKRWRLNNLLHRLDGPAIEGAIGDKFWYVHGQIHRENGPAVELVSGTNFWLFDGQYHRLDGPAMEWSDGRKSWWYQGKRISCSSQEEFEKLIKLKWLW